MRKPKAGVRGGAPGRPPRAYSGDSGNRSTIAPQIERHPDDINQRQPNSRDCPTWLEKEKERGKKRRHCLISLLVCRDEPSGTKGNSIQVS